jgi:ATP-dependent helicase IRC3
LVFCVDLAHVEDLTEVFRSRGIDARWVSSKTADRDRKTLIEGFKKQEFPVLINCELLSGERRWAGCS